MPLTTVHEGRVYDWSHAVGRNAARGPGFNYVQTMCLDKNGVLYATNRGNENNFGMHVNKVKLGGPGEEEHIADFCDYGEGDWKNHRVQKLSPEGKVLMKFGQYGKIEEPEGAYAVTMFGPYVSPTSETAGYPKPGTLNHPTDVAVDTDGDIYVTDWGNHRVCVFDSEGRPICNLIGDAQVLSKWGQQTVDANPDMAKARRRVKSLEPQWRFCFPTAVEFDPATDSIIVAESQRNRLQIYKKVRDYSDFQANL